MATGFTINGVNWDLAAFSNSEQVVSQIKKIYERAAREIAKLSAASNIDPNKLFKLNRYPLIKSRIDKLLREMSAQMQKIIETGTLQSWAIANAKNDALIDFLSKRTGIDRQVLRQRYDYGARNEDALKAFQQRKDDGLGLSQRVWKSVKSAKEEITTAIDTAITEGAPAAKLSQLFRQSLLEPNKRFKRGSKRWANYHPGQGVYRSSYKNAMRVARTEINMAYREADYQRWSQMDFVVGIEVKLSNNPHHCEVCEMLAGKYPKDYVFLGNHPQCRCYAVPILLSPDEYNAFEGATLKGEEYNPEGIIKRTPPGFNRWVKTNQDRINRAKNKPYFIRDNDKYIKVAGSASSGIKGDLVPAGINDYTKTLKITPDKSIFSLLREPVKFSTEGESAYFSLSENAVVIPISERRYRSKWNAESVIYHEFGHAIDNQIGLFKTQELKDLIIKYTNKYAENGNKLFKSIDNGLTTIGEGAYKKGYFDLMEKTGAAHDTLMALNPNFGRGHSKRYWETKGNSEREFIAHMFENYYIGNSVFEKIMPELYAEMKAFMDRVFFTQK